MENISVSRRSFWTNGCRPPENAQHTVLFPEWYHKGACDVKRLFADTDPLFTMPELSDILARSSIQSHDCIRSRLEVNATECSRIDRINELACKAKTQGLTQEEKEEQRLLREEYLAGFRKNLEATLDNVYIREPDGTEHKMKKKCDEQ